ncbi:MAG TPA: hypothetical protein VHA56_16070 [Mucilaginibacter sp.]|nr:hypothetical protein [Mucilaginibacter sp.]
MDADKINEDQLAEQWAVIVVDRWMQALTRYKIGVTGRLMNSFYKELKRANGDVEAVIFKFLKYGRFEDMGVGRGTSLNERVLTRKFDRYRDAEGKWTGHIARKKKPWYSKTFYREVAKLADLYKRDYSTKLVSAIESSLTGDLNMEV